VSKISKALSAIGMILRNPWLLNKVLDEEHYWRKRVETHPGFRDGLPVLKPGAIFGDFKETVEPFAFLDGGSLPTDLALLKKLAARIPGCTYFEIGTWRGESVANVASAAEACFTLNLSAKEMTEKGFNQRYIDLHRFFSKDLKNVTHLEGNTLSFDFQLLNKKFDLVFIDGDHHYEMVRNDTEKVFRHLVHDKTIMVWHDYAFNPETVRFEVLAGILDGSPEHVHPHLFHVAHTLCAVYMPDLTGGNKLDAPVAPSGAFKIDLEFKPGTKLE
jgi:predicted O-methyltransferase YrrM